MFLLTTLTKNRISNNPKKHNYAFNKLHQILSTSFYQCHWSTRYVGFNVFLLLL